MDDICVGYRFKCYPTYISVVYLHECEPSNFISLKFPVGVWTDGIWVFSTGLDQRVRSWHLGECGKLVERACLIVDVPEPEGLDAKACGR